MAAAFATHVAACETVELVVHERIQLVERGLVSVAPLSEQLRDVMWARLRQFAFALGADYTQIRKQFSLKKAHKPQNGAC